MNIQRITISIPGYLYENLIQQISAGQVSRFVTQAIEKELLSLEADPIEKFVSLREKLPKKKTTKILAAIKKGRL